MKIGIKLLGSNRTQQNTLFFIFLSFVYLFILNSISLKIDLLNWFNLKLLLISNLEVLFFSFLVFYFTFKMIKYSKYFLLTYVSYIAFKIFLLFFNDLNKASIILNFGYIFLGGSFYLLLDLELSLAIFSPKFSAYDLDKTTAHNFNAVVVLENNLQIPGKITNIDKFGCCLIFDQENFLKILKNKQVLLSCTLDGVPFESAAKLVTNYDLSYGFEFIKDNSSLNLSWPSLYKICRERNLF